MNVIVEGGGSVSLDERQARNRDGLENAILDAYLHPLYPGEGKESMSWS